MSQQQLAQCYELSILFNQLSSSISTENHQLLESKICQLFESNQKFYCRILMLILSSQHYPKNTKLAITAFVKKFINDNIMNAQTVSISINPRKKPEACSWIGWIQRTLNQATQIVNSSSKQVKSQEYGWVQIIIEVYVRLFLQIQDFGIGAIKKLLLTVKFYLAKKLTFYALALISKLISHSKLCYNFGTCRLYKHDQILQQMITMVIDYLWDVLMVLDTQTQLHFSQLQLLSYGFDVLAGAIKQFTKNMTDWFGSQKGNSRNCMKLTKILENGYKLSQHTSFCEIEDSRDKNLQFIKQIKYHLYLNVLTISSQLLKNIQLSYELLAAIIQISKHLFLMHVDNNPLIGFPIQSLSNIQSGLPALYLEQCVIELIIAAIEIGKILSTKISGQMSVEFKGQPFQKSIYIQQVLLKPMLLSLRIFLRDLRSKQESEIKNFFQALHHIVNQRKLKQFKHDSECFSEGPNVLQGITQPILFFYIRISKALMSSFPQLLQIIKNNVLQIIPYSSENQKQAKLYQNQNKQIRPQRELLVNALILSCIFSPALMQQRQWRFWMAQIFSRSLNWLQVLQSNQFSCNTGKLNMLFNTQIYKDTQQQQFQLVKIANLLVLDYYVDEILHEPNSDCGVVAYLISTLLQEKIYTHKNKIPISLTVSILTKYFTTYHFPYKYEQINIMNILKIPINFHVLPLQLKILAIYYQEGPQNYFQNFCRALASQQTNKLSQELKDQAIQFILQQIQSSEEKKGKAQPELKLESHQLVQQSQETKNICLLEAFISTYITQEGVNYLQSSTRRLNGISLDCNSRNYLMFDARFKSSFKSKVMHRNKTKLRILRTYLQAANKFNSLDKACYFSQLQSITSFVQKLIIKMIQDIDIEQILDGNKINKTVNSGTLSSINNNINCIFMFLGEFGKYCSNILVSLWRSLIQYLQNFGHTDLEVKLKAITILHFIGYYHGQELKSEGVLDLIQIILKQANRINKINRVDKSYFYRGKLYILFILLLKNNLQSVIYFIQETQIQQENKPMTIKNLFSEVFCSCNNYMPLYDIPLLISLIIQIFQNVKQKESEKRQQDLNRSYLHLYFKLLAQSTERLEVYVSYKQKEKFNSLHQYYSKNDEILDQNELQIKALYEIAGQVSRQAIKSGWNTKSEIEALSKFCSFYQKLKIQRSQWVEDVQKKFIDPKTIKNLQRICAKNNFFGEKALIQKCPQNIKRRKIITVQKQ